MQLSEAMTRLERLGNEPTLKTYRRHGVKGPAFGVRYGDLYKLQKEIGVDHALAQGLWKSGNHDARILATLVADAESMSVKDLEAWHDDVDDYGLNDAVASVAARSNVARQVAERWRGAKAEYRSAAGWHVAGGLSAPDTGADDAWLRPLLAEIRAGIHAAPNRTRNAMNSVLISIGGYRPALRDEALAVAKAIGKVEVDHGDTSCKTPDAVEYIEKMAVRHSKKAAKKKTSATKKTATKKTSTKKTSTKKTSKPEVAPAKKTAAKKTTPTKKSSKKKK
jgi:3-methyladenine DNA glycosylase AlkD